MFHLKKPIALSLIVGFIFSASASFAGWIEINRENSGQGKALAFSGDGLMTSVHIDGDAARVLYDSLNVEPQESPAEIPTLVKKTDKAECSAYDVGRVASQMISSSYVCTIYVDTK